MGAPANLTPTPMMPPGQFLRPNFNQYQPMMPPGQFLRPNFDQYQPMLPQHSGQPMNQPPQMGQMFSPQKIVPTGGPSFAVPPGYGMQPMFVGKQSPALNPAGLSSQERDRLINSLSDRFSQGGIPSGLLNRMAQFA
jgi:hypothetical protein